ncbi:MAG: CusA/CzcA family heavy metal efflux RND transporter [Verrucomicrobiota bacterium]
MIHSIIQLCLRNRFLVLVFYVFITAWGIWAVWNTPMDALPDLSENQVIVVADWPGRSAQEIEDQITYPLSSSMQGLPGVKSVRAKSLFGVGMLTIIFEDNVDLYFARTRILERLNSLPFKLPDGVIPTLGPDATGLGWVFQYYLDDTQARQKGSGKTLGELRTIQDWFIRYQINSVPGVAEVASIGGFVEQYQVNVNPNLLRAHNITLSQILKIIESSNRNVGGGNIEINGREITLRGLGYVKSNKDLANLVLGYHQNKPVILEDVASIRMGPAPRRGALDANGKEVVGGIVVMRYGENTLDVIKRVKKKIEEIQPALPEGIEIRPYYDQSELILRAINTLKTTLLEEILLVTLINAIFLLHFRSILITAIPLPLSILISFILMKYFGISSNIMSLAGIAIAIGVLVDAGIVVTEAVTREAINAQEDLQQKNISMIDVVQRACKTVARPLFFSMLIIILAFVPVFALTGASAKLFSPLAFTKTFAMIGATILAITLIPVLASFFLGGKLRDENQNPLMRFALWLYMPVLKLALRFRAIVISIALAILGGAIYLALQMGWGFMPELNEGAFLSMPQTVASASVPEIKRVMSAQDKMIKELFPEVENVVGKLGRANTATDPAPTAMLETIITLKPKEAWRGGMTEEKLRQEIQQALMSFPGFPPSLLQPIETRILMLQTGIRGQVAAKIFGSDLQQLEAIASEIEAIMRNIPGASGVAVDLSQNAPYLEIEVNHQAAALYGVPVAEVLDVIETAIGGKTITTTIQGRERFGIRVRYPRELRHHPDEIGNVLVTSKNGRHIPLSKVAEIELVSGPAWITSENGLMRVFVQSNVRDRDLRSFVKEAQEKIHQEVTLPPGTYISWGGQYENLIKASQTMATVIPTVLFIIFILLYLTYRSFAEAAHVLLAVPFALSGGVFLQWIMGIDFSVAVLVGYIALFGTAVETGVVMVIYLEEAVNRWREKRHKEKAVLNFSDLKEAVIEGSALRLRPKLMTVATILASLSFILLPVLSQGRTGIEIMRPLAVPIFGGMVSSLLHILIVTPVIFLTLQELKLKKEQNHEAKQTHKNL